MRRFGKVAVNYRGSRNVRFHNTLIIHSETGMCCCCCFYTSTKSWSCYIFTAVCLCVSVCVSGCACEQNSIQTDAPIWKTGWEIVKISFKSSYVNCLSHPSEGTFYSCTKCCQGWNFGVSPKDSLLTTWPSCSHL